ncbi:MAG: hypothetical protein K9J37_15660 [Saprospiraceae bacterium]|nr:hypothetical protein [Saprospiraceae bacterium]MCF8251348.1 hypothetical protein [Saprospiraceae bacterium]MCF8280523.1 hypothetical protein [Bacteroidales bacterium]MCF8313259.1 hypothetical protein [Saprospiraceae bacterium]MCF8441706.1 hypothetical protein [Saprospiraceae bacterium]
MLKITSILIGALIFVCTLTSHADTAAKLTVAQTILDKLYLAAGQFQIEKPRLEMSTTSTKGAAYYYAKNLIVLDEKVYEICRSMGSDSSKALAFILAHELSHAFQKEAKKGRTTNFLAYDQDFEADTRNEKTADINGVFTAYLAGYRLSSVVPKLLPILYDTYGLTGRMLKGYPSLDERRRSVKEVLEITNELIDLYETSSYLLAAGYYDMAATNYEYILKYYQGREVFNNLGVLYLYQAMEYYLPQTDRFVYPIEIDAATQLKKIEKARGPQALSFQDKLTRMQLLNKATNYFMQAIALDRNFSTAKLNYVCALSLTQKQKDAMAYFQKKKLRKDAAKNAAINDKYLLVQGILSAQVNDNKAAEASFRDAIKSKSQPVAAAASYNLNVLLNKATTVAPENEFQFPAQFKMMVNAIKMPKISQVQPLALDENGNNVRHLKEGNTETFTFGNKQRNVLSIIRFQTNLAPNIDLLNLAEPINRSFFYNLVTTNTGYFLMSEKDGIVIKVSDTGKVEEMAKLIKH